MTDRLHSGLDRRSVLGSLGLGGAMAAVGTPTIVLAQAEAPPMPREDGGTLPKPREDTLPPASSGAAAEAVEAVRDAILRISREVWATPELSLAEVKSHRIHLRELEAAGFTTKSRGTSGIPTAFISEWSQGSG